MGLMEEYQKEKRVLGSNRGVWNPDRKAVVFPSGVVIWLGGRPDAPPLAVRLRMEGGCRPSPFKLAKYVVTGKVPRGGELTPLEPGEVLTEEPSLGLDLLKEVPDPYRAKLAAWLLPRT
jgi:hypothetical protein